MSPAITGMATEERAGTGRGEVPHDRTRLARNPAPCTDHACAPVPVLTGGLRERHVERDLEKGGPVTPDVRRRAEARRALDRLHDRLRGTYERAAGARLRESADDRAGRCRCNPGSQGHAPATTRHAVVVGEEHHVGQGLPRARVPGGGSPPARDPEELGAVPPHHRLDRVTVDAPVVDDQYVGVR